MGWDWGEKLVNLRISYLLSEKVNWSHCNPFLFRYYWIFSLSRACTTIKFLGKKLYTSKLRIKNVLLMRKGKVSSALNYILIWAHLEIGFWKAIHMSSYKFKWEIFFLLGATVDLVKGLQQISYFVTQT